MVFRFDVDVELSVKNMGCPVYIRTDQLKYTARTLSESIPS